jgi:hypothetical protein
MYEPMVDDVKAFRPEVRHLSTGPSDIEYKMSFTRNRELIAKYKDLREALYGIDPRFVGFRIFNQMGAENYEDPDDQMLILHDGKNCYGGACLRISTPQRQVILDMENDILPPSGKYYFSLRERLPELKLEQYAYAEFNRIVLDPRLRKGTALKRIFQAVLERCIDHRVRYIFSISDMSRGRLYRQIYANAGMDCTIRKDVHIPMRNEYEDIKMYMLYGDMKPFHAVPSDPEAANLLQPSNDFEFY